MTSWWGIVESIGEQSKQPRNTADEDRASSPHHIASKHGRVPVRIFPQIASVEAQVWRRRENMWDGKGVSVIQLTHSKFFPSFKEIVYRYAALSCHVSREQCRKDDLESWLYQQVRWISTLTLSNIALGPDTRSFLINYHPNCLSRKPIIQSSHELKKGDTPRGGSTGIGTILATRYSLLIHCQLLVNCLWYSIWDFIEVFST